jgi:extracellular elastinolytic metalloproteinase
MVNGGRVWVAAAAVLALTGVPSVTASAAPRFQGEDGGDRGKDVRQGRKAPTPQQRDAAAQSGLTVRFNEHGTPSTVTARRGALQRGGPAGPVAAARGYLRDNRQLFGLSPAAVSDLEVVSVSPLGAGDAVLLRQRFGGLPAGLDGLVTVGVRDGQVLYASSSLSRDAGAPARATLSAGEAVLAAARDAGRRLSPATIDGRGRRGRWTAFEARGLTDLVHVRPVAVPTPANGVRAAYQVVLVDEQAAEPLGFTSYVDARTGDVLVREDIVDHAIDNPTFDVFPGTPPIDYSSTDTRELWCWAPGAPGCVRAVQNPASPFPWDVDARRERPTFRTEGNNAHATEKWNTNDTRRRGVNYTESDTRDFAYPWTNQWFEAGCNPSAFDSPTRNDIDAAASNLFAMHNRMHDWSYRLGFTETAWNLQEFNFGRGGDDRDAEHGNVQAGGIVGGPPGFESRDNANQITPPDGVTPVTNMYLWQPIAGAFYAPCVDGDYDMTVIGHEYTHAISNRMVAGPDNRLVGLQANAMGESWSDLMAVEYLNEYGFVPIAGENPFAVGPYVTGDPQAGIRNYGMNASPLNYTNVAYDLTGPQVHADGEIWSATNFDIRSAFNAAYDARFPSGAAGLQASCADGTTPLAQCPGNRRWAQLVFDAWLLMARGDVSMVDARDAMLAADRIRFTGANQALLWNAFAARGLGQGATSTGPDDVDPRPSFASPNATEGTIVFAPTDDSGAAAEAELFVGRYQARTVPVADSDPDTALGSSVELVPGTYEVLVRGNGFGTHRQTIQVAAGQTATFSPALAANLASAARGATATGDGAGQARLIDDTESTQWESVGAPVAGRQVTVRLAQGGPPPQVRRVQVSAALSPPQNRFSALRSFEILACNAGSDGVCSDADFGLVFSSPGDAFPSVAPRPRQPDLIMRSFAVPRTRATHVRFRVVANQCTGAPDYAGEQDQDPRARTDCTTASPQALNVRAAELQVFER